MSGLLYLVFVYIDVLIDAKKTTFYWSMHYIYKFKNNILWYIGENKHIHWWYNNAMDSSLNTNSIN